MKQRFKCKRLVRDVTIYRSKKGYYLVAKSKKYSTDVYVLNIRAEPSSSPQDLDGGSLSVGNDDEVSNVNVFMEEQKVKRADLQATLISIAKQDNNSKQLDFIGECYGVYGLKRMRETAYLMLIVEAKKQGDLFGSWVFGVENIQCFDLIEMRALQPLVNFPTSAALAPNGNETTLIQNACLSILEVTKELYFSYTFDLTRRLQTQWSQYEDIIERKRNEGGRSTIYSERNSKYVWNYFLIREFLRPDGNGSSKELNKYVLPCIHGYFQQRRIVFNVQTNSHLALTLIGRRSRIYAGTRYLRRGLNERGYCANDVETEQISSYECVVPSHSRFSSVVQVRASIPLFWGHTNLSSPKPDIVLGDHNSVRTFNAISRHFLHLCEAYGTKICILNLIRKSEKKEKENKIGKVFEEMIHKIEERKMKASHYQSSQFPCFPAKLSISYHSYDFLQRRKEMEEECSKNTEGATPTNKILQELASISEDVFTTTGAFFPSTLGARMQEGVLRTNCIDCLDRTNIAQFCYGKVVLSKQLESFDIYPDSSQIAAINSLLLEMWTEHGNAIARQYGGSETMHSLDENKNGTTLSSSAKTALIAAKRYIANTFSDNDRQQAMSIMLGESKSAEVSLSFSSSIPRGKEVIEDEALKIELEEAELHPFADKHDEHKSLQLTEFDVMMSYHFNAQRIEGHCSPTLPPSPSLMENETFDFPREGNFDRRTFQGSQNIQAYDKLISTSVVDKTASGEIGEHFPKAQRNSHARQNEGDSSAEQGLYERYLCGDVFFPARGSLGHLSFATNTTISSSPQIASGRKPRLERQQSIRSLSLNRTKDTDSPSKESNKIPSIQNHSYNGFEVTGQYTFRPRSQSPPPPPRAKESIPAQYA